MRKYIYRRMMWGGFVDGRLHLWRDKPVGGKTAPAIFTLKRDALAAYEDVRRIEIREMREVKP